MAQGFQLVNDFVMTSALNLKPAFQRRVSQLPKLFSAFFETLSDEALTRLYSAHGRVWLNSGDFELRLSYGPPESRGAHDWIHSEPSVGRWVYQAIGFDTHENHPWEEDGGPVDWVPAPEWVRCQLLESVGDLADNMQHELEQDVEMAERWLNNLVAE
jgi:hypothetical protein